MLTSPESLAAVAGEVPGGSQVTFNLRPPAFAWFLGERKMRFGPRMHWMLRLLAMLRVLRGTPFDPFGRAHVRRVERAMRDHYRSLVEGLADGLSAEGYDRAVRLAGLPEVVRGYEGVKLRNVEAYRGLLRTEGVEPTF
jgi:indolepyruvate ferredoxin oxidoreductase